MSVRSRWRVLAPTTLLVLPLGAITAAHADDSASTPASSSYSPAQQAAILAEAQRLHLDQALVQQAINQPGPLPLTHTITIDPGPVDERATADDGVAPNVNKWTPNFVVNDHVSSLGQDAFVFSLSDAWCYNGVIVCGWKPVLHSYNQTAWGTVLGFHDGGLHSNEDHYYSHCTVRLRGGATHVYQEEVIESSFPHDYYIYPTISIWQHFDETMDYQIVGTRIHHCHDFYVCD